MPYHIVCLAGKKIQVEDNGLWCFFFTSPRAKFISIAFHPRQLHVFALQKNLYNILPQK